LNPIKTYFNWSTGKDSALALYHLQQDNAYDVGHLLTSVNQHHGRVSMHGLRRDLMQLQIEALNIPFSTIELPEQPDMEAYELVMKAGVLSLQAQGFTTAAFGDIFLEDLRVYREKQLAAYEIETVFPLWKKDTRQLLTEFIELGFKAILVCVNAQKLDVSFAGRIIDETFLNDLPADVDPCGENGEFHTFCFDGPIFNAAIPFQIGEKIYREYDAPAMDGKEDKIGFWFQDLTMS
jgi:uncharacterized protein (TIGR00290 family)